MNETIYHISTFRPEACGIAHWTEDKINYLHRISSTPRNRVIAVNGFRKLREYTDLVEFAFERDKKEDYVKTAESINKNPEAKLVWVEHEFGIFGGESVSPISHRPLRDGSYLLDFLDNINKPVGITCHTVLKKGEEEFSIVRGRTLQKILERINGIITISNTSKNILVEEYGVEPEKINVIYHGTHEFAETTKQAKNILGFNENFVISTVGLVRKKRGMEKVIRALPKVVEKYPEVLYVIAGATHPKEIVGGKEIYREELEREVIKQGVEKNVYFVNKNLPLNSLLRHIQASDICITPYEEPKQVSSGVLSFCVGLNKPVISSPFFYAKEILSGGKGILLPDYSSDSIEKALLEVLENRESITKIKENMGELREKMKWPNVARTFYNLEMELIQ